MTGRKKSILQLWHSLEDRNPVILYQEVPSVWIPVAIYPAAVCGARVTAFYWIIIVMEEKY
jgi:hypothetical protein